MRVYQDIEAEIHQHIFCNAARLTSSNSGFALIIWLFNKPSFTVITPYFVVSDWNCRTRVIKAKPEFEDVKRAALQTNIPFMRVYQDIEAEIHQHILNN